MTLSLAISKRIFIFCGLCVCLFVCSYYLFLWANIIAKLLASSFHRRLDVLSYFLYCEMYDAVDDDDDDDEVNRTFVQRFTMRVMLLSKALKYDTC